MSLTCFPSKNILDLDLIHLGTKTAGISAVEWRPRPFVISHSFPSFQLLPPHTLLTLRDTISLPMSHAFLMP